MLAGLPDSNAFASAISFSLAIRCLKIGVVVSYTGDADTGKGIAMHVAAFNPVAVNAGLPDSNAFASAISFSLAIRSAGTASAFTATGLNAVDKYLNEVALDRQMYVIDNDKKVADVLKATGTTVSNFFFFSDKVSRNSFSIYSYWVECSNVHCNTFTNGNWFS
jgi:translation elongation factor EF-Ts